MDALRGYNQATSGLLALQAIPLLSAPSMLVWMLSPNPQSVTSLETFLCRAWGVSLLLIAFLNLLFSGEVRRFYGEGDSTEQDMHDPYAIPTLIATLLYHMAATTLFYSYSYSRYLSGSWLTLGSIMHVILAASAMLLLMFGGDKGRISKRTGADKRTSGFPFKNAAADKKRRR